MKNKERFQAHISSFWEVYIIYAIAAVLVWTYAVTLFTRDKPQEVVNVLVLAYDADTKALTGELEKNKPDYLKHVRVTFENRNGRLVNIRYQGIASDMDIFVLPESFVSDNDLTPSFLILDADYVTEVFGEVSFYYYDGRAYGIKIFDKNNEDDGSIRYTDNSFEKENYYLFINVKSLHMGELNGKKLTGGLDVIGSMLENGPVFQK